MRRALITGVTGQDGSYMAEFLLGKGYQVSGLIRRLSIPNLSRIGHLIDQIELVEGDLTDQGSLITAIKKTEPNEVYNFAAQSFVPTSWNQPVLTGDVTGLGVVRLLEAIRTVNEEIRFYQASTSEMFGLAEETPQRETTRFHPRSPYGVAKVYAHWITVNYRESYGMHASAGIAFNHESPRRGIEFVTRKISDGVARVHLGLSNGFRLGNLEAKRDWGYAGDYVEAMWRMLQEEKPDDYVIATGETHSVREFVQEAFRIVGIEDWERHIHVDRSLFRPTEVHDLCGDASKIMERLGWRPKVFFRELVQMMVQADVERLKTGP